METSCIIFLYLAYDLIEVSAEKKKHQCETKNHIRLLSSSFCCFEVFIELENDLIVNRI